MSGRKKDCGTRIVGKAVCQEMWQRNAETRHEN